MLPSVTKIISIMKDDNNPVGGALLDQIKKRMELAGIRGTAVHKASANYARNLFSPLPPDYMGYFLSFQGWFDTYVEEVLLVEEYLEDRELGFCGHPDFIFRLRGDRHPSLWDLKTPVNLIKKWRLQLAGYKRLALRRFPKLDRIGSIRLDPNGGKPKLKDYDNYEQDINIFLSLLNVYRWWEIK
jgi:hypothetical protein